MALAKKVKKNSVVKKDANLSERKSLARSASNFAKRVLPLFEYVNPEDDRPRKAIEAAREWARGKITISEARKAAFAAHAAAREVTDLAARAAARSAGHAAATAHVAGHAKHAVVYAAKAEDGAGKVKVR
jgi:hypothetical protein